MAPHPTDRSMRPWIGRSGAWSQWPSWRTIRASSRPRGALQTEAWRWFLVDRDAPEEVKDVLRHYAMRYSGPGGLTEQDDMENWNYASAASKGVIARRYPYNYEMGLGLPYPDYGMPGVITERIAEHNQRGFYQRWAELMQAPSRAALAKTRG